MNLINITINGNRRKVPRGISIYNACYLNNIQLPRFCYHESLAVAGNCRTCYVEVKNSPKLVVACAILVSENMIISTETDFVKQGRINSIELILKNHPLDCPICDQGGACDLQEQSYIYGSDRANFFGKKRANQKIILGSEIKTQMNRCITCTRCVRFLNNILSNSDLNTYGRGEDTIISHIRGVKNHPNLSQVARLCPVGALTLATNAFHGRPWQRTNFTNLSIEPNMNISSQFDVTKKLIKSNLKVNIRKWY
jgi:NADH dehydrogenase/NADH:ubiquinone oxidoreductase subunit G